MKEKSPDYYKELYNTAWDSALKLSQEDYGDTLQSLEFLEKINLLHTDDKILEIGCGIGKLCHSLHNKGFVNLIGTDISLNSINYDKTKYPQLELRVMNADKLEFQDKSFDVCLSFDLIEHLPDITEHFNEVNRILKPNGYYLFQTPNIVFNSILETWKARGFKWKAYHPSLQFPWTLRRALKKSGFMKVKFIRIPPLSDYKLIQLPGFLRLVFKAIPWSSLPVSLQIGFWCIVTKENNNSI